jgi:hypothetical protein
MDRIKAHYDRYLLMLGGVLLAGVALLVVMNAGQLPAQFAPVTPPTSGETFAEDAAIARLRADRAQMDARQTWQDGDGSLFVSRVYLLRDGALVDILESGAELFPGMANSWILEHNLDYTDANLPDNDPDADGFTNREEFEGKTNPQDAASKPALWTKLRLVGSKIEKLRVKFEGLSGGSLDEVQINTVNADDPKKLSGGSQFYPRKNKQVRTANGEDIEVDENVILLAEKTTAGLSYFVPTPLQFEKADFNQPRFDSAVGAEVKTPYVVLRSMADGREIRLEQGEVKDSPYSLATLQDTRSGGQTYELRSGETFKLGEADTYKLVDAKEEKAIIENLQTGDRHDIPFRGAAPAAEVPPEVTPQ